MRFLIDFFEWLYGKLKGALAFVASTTGSIVSAFAACAAAVGTMFSRFTWLDQATSLVNQATAQLSQLAGQTLTGGIDLVIGFLALDRCLSVLTLCVTVTIGVTVLIFVTVFTSIFVLIPTILTVRAILKAVKTATVGVLDP